MARGLFRQFSMAKVIGAYRSQWKRFWMRLFTFGLYGRRGMGWWRDPERALYNRRYHRSSISILKMLGYKPSSLTFLFYMLFATAANIVMTPVDIATAVTTAHKIKRARKEREVTREQKASSSSPKETKTTKLVQNRMTTSADTSEVSKREILHTPSAPRQTTERTAIAEKKPPYTPPHAVPPVQQPRVTSTTSKPHSVKPASVPRTATRATCVRPAPPSQSLYTPAPVGDKIEDFKPISSLSEPAAEPSENTPKSKPRCEGDQYIRKRMIVAGACYCDKVVLDRLAVGCYLDLVAEPDNPYDKDAVRLDFEGEKIGYVAMADRLPFVTCLKLGRGVYGVVTDIRDMDGRWEVEYETWFLSKK